MNALSFGIGRELYESVRTLPIIDYHNHLSLADLAGNKRFSDIYELWIKPDPYKHRAMRMCGVPEREITGDAPDEIKFARWCETLPRLWGNPLAQWSQMELESLFGTDILSDRPDPRELCFRCSAYLKNHDVTPETLFDLFRVELACPCVSLTDDVAFFEKNKRLAPSLRGDDILTRAPAFIDKLARLTGRPITDGRSFRSAVQKRLDALERVGLCFADHALDDGFRFDKNAPEGSPSSILVFLGEEYARRGIVMQLHLGALRTTSTRLRAAAGPAGGYAAIGNSVDFRSLTLFLDELDQKPCGLPKTVLFPLNPADNAAISVLSGSFSKDGVAGLVTQGPAWWWCDHRHGIVDMLEKTAAFGVLSNFAGMTTDSRSFLSLVRHDYFRRVLCTWIAGKTEDGEFCGTENTLKEMLLRICYKNAQALTKKNSGKAE